MTSREEKEAFYQGHKGTNSFHVFIVLLPLCLGFVLNRVLLLLLRGGFDAKPETWSKGFRLLLEVVVIVLPTLFVFTIGHSMVYEVVMFQTVAIFVLGLTPLGQAGPVFHFDRLFDSTNAVGVINRNKKGTFRLRSPAMSLFRGGLLLGTAVGILAVDFPAFPRFYAKTEDYGASLMDIGVGGFVFAAGFSAQRPSFTENLFHSLPVLGLGFARWLSVWLSDYHTHTSEYGRDLNFFFVLAFLQLGAWPLRRLADAQGKRWRALVLAGLGVVVVGGYELLVLRQSEWRNWLIGGGVDRSGDDLLAANREGIAATVGYVGLYLIAESIGSSFRLGLRSASMRNVMLIFVVTTLLAIILLSIPPHLPLLPLTPISRRLANAKYVVWVIAVSSSQLLLFTVADVICDPLHRLQHVPAPPSFSQLADSTIAESINNHALLFFLIANVFTGLTNKLVDTIHTPDTPALLYLTIYLFTLLFTLFFAIDNPNLFTSPTSPAPTSPTAPRKSRKRRKVE